MDAAKKEAEKKAEEARLLKEANDAKILAEETARKVKQAAEEEQKAKNHVSHVPIISRIGSPRSVIPEKRPPSEGESFSAAAASCVKFWVFAPKVNISLIRPPPSQLDYLNDELLKTQLEALKSTPRRTNSSEFVGLNAFMPSEMVRSSAAKVALRPRPKPKDYTVVPPSTTMSDGSPEPTMERLNAELARKEYEEVKLLRSMKSPFAPASIFLAKEALRSSFTKSVLAGGEYVLNVYLGASVGTDGNLSPLRLTYHTAGEEDAKAFDPEGGWLRPEATIPLDSSFDAAEFYKDDVTIFTEDMMKDHVEFAESLVFSDLRVSAPKFGAFDSGAFVASETAPCVWNELSTNAVADDLALDQQLKTLAFRETRKPFDVNRHRRKLAAYFGKKYGKDNARNAAFTWDIKEVVEAVAEAEHLKICAANKMKEAETKDELAALNTRELSDKAKKVRSSEQIF